MASRRLQAVIDLQDNLSSKLQRASSNVDQFGNRVQQQQSKLNGLGTAAEKAGGFLLKVGGAAVAGGIAFVTAKFLALKAAVSTVGLAAFNTNSNMEGMAMSLKTLYAGDTAGYQKQFGDMINFAKNTASELPQVFQATVGLKGLGLDPNAWLPKLDDLAASTGGKASMEEALNSLRYIKSGVYGEGFQSLAQQFNISRTEFKAMGLEFSKGGEYLGTTNQALNALTKIMDQRHFTGLGKEMASTSKGILSNLSDVWTSVSMGLMGWDAKEAKYRDGGLFNQIKKAIKGVMDWGNELANSSFLNGEATITEKLQYIWKQVQRAVVNWQLNGGQDMITKWAETLGSGLGDAITGMFTGKSKSMWGEMGKAAANGLMDGLKKHFKLDEIWGSDRGQLLGKVLGAGAALKFAPALFKGMGWMGELLQGIGGGGAAAGVGAEGVAAGAAGGGAAIGGGALAAGALAALAAAVYLMMQTDRVKAQADGPAKQRTLVQSGAGIGGGILGGVIGSLIAPGIGTAVGAAIGIAVGEALAAVWQTGFIQKAVGALPGLLNSLVNMLLQGVGYLVGMVLNLLGWLVGVIFGGITAVFVEITTFILRLFLDPLGLIKDAWNGIVNIILGLWDKLTKLWEGFKTAIGGFGDFFTGGFKGVAGGAIQSLQDTVAKITGHGTVKAPAHHGGVASADDGLAILKAGETVLDPGLSSFIRNSASRSSGRSAGGGDPVTIQISNLVGTAHIREEADVNKVAQAITDELKRTLNNRGNNTLMEVAV